MNRENYEPLYKLKIVRGKEDSEETPDYNIVEEGSGGFIGEDSEERKQAVIEAGLKTMRENDELTRILVNDC